MCAQAFGLPTNSAEEAKFLPSKWDLDAIKNQNIKISRICDLNDPFDLLPYDFTDKERPDAQIHARTELLSGRGIGLLCFSFKWSNPVLWAHYADNHNGICLDFDLPDDVADKVRYVKKRERLPSDRNEDEETALQWAKKLLFTKFHGWEYEAECRVFVGLDTKEEDEDGNYFKNFEEKMVLREVVLGCEYQLDPTGVLESLLEPYDEEVRVLRARPSDESFYMIEDTAFCHRL